MNRNIVFAGFAIFAMFFGSGNIVFPLSLGRVSGDVWVYAMIGFFFTAVIVPFMGLVSIVLLKGSSSRFFGLVSIGIQHFGHKIGLPQKALKFAGDNLSALMQLFIIALIGPFCIIPRCITVSYGAFKFTHLGLSEFLFSALFCAVLWALTMRREKVIPLISKLLTPIKFSLIVLLIGLGIYWAPTTPLTTCNAMETFQSGVLSGYNTMDLSAAIFFAAAIMGFFKSVEKGNTSALLKDGLYASLIGAGILTGIYICFVYLGATYAELTCNVANVEILPTIAQHALGSSASIIFCITIVFSCLTTSVALMTCWMDTLKELNIFNNISYQTRLIISLVVSYSIAIFLGFDKILHLMGPVLEVMYPALILMAIVHIAREAYITKKRPL
jgi:LIVCS family branched-chain amino acid:cation transporter